MHICFIIDNCPATLQTYTYTAAQSNTNSIIPILDSLKISIQLTLNDLFRNGALLRDCQNLHLFQTSTPFTPISSFEHDILHFNYQLKQIKISETMITYPAETIKFALQHISRYRILTETQTILGYRSNAIYQPAIIMFFTFGLTPRKISKLQLSKLYRYMRCQYKFVHFRVCYGMQSEGDKNLQKFKSQLENSIENKRLVQWAETMNGGEHKNIIKYAGKQNLSGMIMSNMFANYVPSLSCQLVIDCEMNSKLFPDYFKNSQINCNNFLTKQQNNIFKIQLLMKNDKNTHNLIPLPYDIIIKQMQRDGSSITSQPQIQELPSLQFCVDLSKKLVRSISNLVLFDKYMIPSTNPKLIKLQKQLERLGINQAYFPLYSMAATVSKKQKDLCLLGLLHFHIDALNANFFELAISFPNFPLIQWIINAHQSQSSYLDTRRVEKLLLQYYNEIPQFYHKFLIQYFQYLNSQLAYKYESITMLAHNNASLVNSSIKINNFKERQTLFDSMRIRRHEQKMQLQKIKRENVLNHLNHNAECCLIYGDIDKYIQYSKNQSYKFRQSKVSKIEKNQKMQIVNNDLQQGINVQNTIESSLKLLLDEISKFNYKYGMNGYFSGNGGWKQGPITRELDKYGRGIQRIVNQGSILEGQQITNVMLNKQNGFGVDIMQGLFSNKKVKYSQDLSKTSSVSSRTNKEDQSQSVMPTKLIPQQLIFALQNDQQQSQSSLHPSPQNPSHEVSEFQIREYELKSLNNNIYGLNSVAINNIVQDEYNLQETEQMLKVEKGLLMKKIEIEKEARLGNVTCKFGKDGEKKINEQVSYNILTNLEDNHIPKIVKRSSSIQYIEDEEQDDKRLTEMSEEPMEHAKSQKQRSKVSLLINYINTLSMENPIKMKLNIRNIRGEMFMENLEKLKKIGFVKDIEKYKNEGISNK